MPSVHFSLNDSYIDYGYDIAKEAPFSYTSKKLLMTIIPISFFTGSFERIKTFIKLTSKLLQQLMVSRFLLQQKRGMISSNS